ncbi:hypothetical protein B0J13DRAFT_538469 [Dactylonectria estremocensis]|uniref:Uncharacterized protein n=1 Tax=Dactylonectria estremocensis TaxID=1079267 RepID=A0A9P9JEE4_9HYPO|nr:hypothetical protein B0J13DRAFT_538469 [Dactylonectria estremocensis]
MREDRAYRCREHGCGGFVDYAKAVKNRLARHDFALALEFELAEDAKKQDTLTTWIEYLSSKYWWLDHHTDRPQILEPDHDKAWQKVVDDKLLRRHETKEYKRTFKYSMEREKQQCRAKEVTEGLEVEAKRIYALN